MFISLHNDEFQSMIDEADLDGDGMINYEEFFSMMNSIQ
jgi:Ca2+-binding EF-hand superfamily protein